MRRFIDIMEAEDPIQSVIKRLRANPLAPHILIFGSYVVPNSQPKDVDAFVDLDAAAETLSAQAIKTGVKDILAISGRYYSYLDPFLLKGGVLFTRNEEATTFIRAKNAKQLINAGRQGRPISEF